MEEEQISGTPSRTGTGQKRIKGIEVILFLSDITSLNPGKLRRWVKVFSAVHVVSPGVHPENLPDGICRHHYEADEYRSTIWNRILKHVQAPWALFLEDDETVDLPGLPSGQDLDMQKWMPALIQWQDGELLRQCYHMRLVTAGAEAPFQGKHLPDCTEYITNNAIYLNAEPIVIHRESTPYDNLNPEEELAAAKPSPQVYLAIGARHYRERRYVHAAAQYRKVLNTPDVLPYDRLAALNGLSGAMAEQYKWSQAIELAAKSIKEESRQRLPYLILFRIHQLAKHWEEAHDILERYYELRNELSAANFDKVLPEEETLMQLADLAIRAGLRGAAFKHYKRLYAIRGGDVDPDTLQRLLLLAIEQSDYGQAVRFFNERFAGQFPDKLDERSEEQLFDMLALFMEKGWYQFPAGKYQDLLDYQPGNETYLRRWLVALSKSKDIGKAQKVVAKMRIRKKTG